MTTLRATHEKDELLAQLRACGQEHLLAFWDKLNASQRQLLAEEIASIDFAQVARLFQQATATSGAAPASDRFVRALPPPAIRLANNDPQAAANALRRGQQALAAGRVGAVLVAGGQGSRLGFEHPKGFFEIGPVSRACLFQILFEKLLATRERYGASIPLYLMTSPATHDETVAELARLERFGLPAEDLFVFCQGTMPAVDANSGRLLLAEQGELFLSPDGHGGMLKALGTSGALADIRRRGIEQLFYMQVDNPLVGVCDPQFIGYHLAHGSEASTQVVAKLDPLERVGNVVSLDDRVEIIEYSDLPEDLARRRAADGSLELWAGNIAVHVFDVAFLERMAADGGHLPFHIARKAVPYVDAQGRAVDPQQPNAIKFEQFIFDLLPAARKSLVVEVDTAAVFAPVKNATGAPRDAPETVERQMIALYRQWLQAAGAKVAEDARVEVSPLFALDAAELAAKIKPGLHVEGDRYFR